jgi:hypothetical protein
MGLCASIPAEGPGLNYAMRRTCGKHEYSRAIKYVRTEALYSWTCVEFLHVFKRHPALADNYEEYTDSNKLGLVVYTGIIHTVLGSVKL